MKYFLLLSVALLFSCSQSNEKLAKPDPIKLDDDEIGYYTQMIVADHSGPKAQLWLDDRSKPIWFVDVRDAILFKRNPEEADNISIIYAHDMAKNPDYRNVQDFWVDLENAVFVIKSERKGGMGMPETIPFSNRQSADEFINKHGGELVLSMAAISQLYLTEMPSVFDLDPEYSMSGR
jgi:copper chaperone NosL